LGVSPCLGRCRGNNRVCRCTCNRNPPCGPRFLSIPSWDDQRGKHIQRQNCDEEEFRQTFGKVVNNMFQGGNVLVHCVQGQIRSPVLPQHGADRL
jgi:hypothetical protein